MKKKNEDFYELAGVNIETGNNFVDKIKPFAKQTLRPGAVANIGGFGALFDLKAAGYIDPILVSATDGVGTKIKIALDSNDFTSIGIDLVAMCVNDLVCLGAEPLFFLDYYATGSLDLNISSDILLGIVSGCKQANVALIGGETAEMPGVYANNDFDLAGFAVGALNRGEEIPNNVCEGDIILGLGSSGIHSNGFSLIRKLIEENDIDLNLEIGNQGKTLSKSLLEPTKIYVSSIEKLKRDVKIKGIAHITGGGIIENLPRVLPDGLGAEIDIKSWEVPFIFKWLFKEMNIPDKQKLKTFNCGIGMTLIVSSENQDLTKKTLLNSGELVFEIGKVVNRKGIKFSGELLL